MNYIYIVMIGVVSIATLSLALALVDKSLYKRWKDHNEKQFRYQLIMLILTLFGMLGIILALPISETLKAQLISLLGILLSASIALSSTTFVGNALAGIMLKALKNISPGDFVSVENYTGRFIKLNLLNSEIQTEHRDLVSIPNLYLATKPVKIVQKSGTMISVEISLGYDIHHAQIKSLLAKSVNDCGLTDPFIHIRQLQDHSILYRAGGYLEDVNNMISKRSLLHEKILDTLHENHIEIVSPNFMNTRSVPEQKNFIPPEAFVTMPSHNDTAFEQLAFDKADEAAQIEELAKEIDSITDKISAVSNSDLNSGEQRIQQLKKHRERLEIQLEKLKEEGAKTE